MSSTVVTLKTDISDDGVNNYIGLTENTFKDRLAI